MGCLAGKQQKSLAPVSLTPCGLSLAVVTWTRSMGSVLIPTGVWEGIGFLGLRVPVKERFVSVLGARSAMWQVPQDGRCVSGEP